MNDNIPPTNTKVIHDMLPDTIKCKTNVDDLQELIISSKKEFARKRFYKLSLSKTKSIHLTYGLDLESVYLKTKSFYQVAPQMTCKPLFINSKKSNQLFGQEFFNGIPIDQKFENNEISEKDVASILESIIKNFDAIEKKSNTKKFREEYEKFKQNTLSKEILGVVDKQFLEFHLLPKLEKAMLLEPLTTRWSSGDLAARNILVDENINFRIIDCEFAQKTHFHDEDWIRLSTFSLDKFKRNPIIKRRLNKLSPWLHIYFCLKQISLNQQIFAKEMYLHYASQDLFHSFNIFEQHNAKSINTSLLFLGMRNSIENSNQLIAEEKSLRLKKVSELDQEKVLRRAKEDELDQEKAIRRAKEDELDQEKAIRTAKENELDQEKAIRTAKEDQLAKQIQITLSNEIVLENEKLLRISIEDDLKIEKQNVLLLKSELENEKKVRILTETNLKNKKERILTLKADLDNEKKQRITAQKNLTHEKICVQSLESKLKKENQLNLTNEVNLDNTRKSVLNKESELIVKNDKILRMQQSFSWKITQPLRFLRRKLIDPIKHRGDTTIQTKVVQKSYQDWIQKYDTITPQKTINLLNAYKQLEHKPLLSIIIPVFNPPLNFFEEAIKSVKSQIYENWEICFADDMSTDPGVHKIIKKHVRQDTRIKAYFNKDHSHISVTSNNALSIARGKFVVLMDHDDLLRPHSLLRLAQYYNHDNNIKLIYSDEDKIDESGNRTCPYFKPDWNPDLLLAQNYLCHLFCAETALIRKLGGFRQGFEGSQDWDLILRLTEHVDEKEIVHIPEILYHWRIHSGSVADNIDNKSYAVKAARKAVEEHLMRSKIEAKVSVAQNQFLRIDRQSSIQRTTKASIIIPTKNNFEVLKTCIDSIFDKTSPDLFELIVVDNQTTDSNSLSYFSKLKELKNCKILNYDNDFNYSAINNYAAKYAKNEILVFLNDDTQIITEKWLQELISQAIRPNIGAVGAKLFYPNGSIQHAGIVLGYCKVAGEIMKGLAGNHPGQMQRANLVHNVSAVTGACLAIEKKKFYEVNGFNSENLKVAFNDVDFCLKLLKSGYKNLFTPEAKLFHYESKSRGKEDTFQKQKRFASEIKYMIQKWNTLLQFDPNYNPNLSLEWSEQFAPSFPPRKLPLN